jgi:protein gp37
MTMPPVYVPNEFISRVFEIMHRANRHTFQVLTKRAERLEEWTNQNFKRVKWPSNVWLGVSVENDEYRWRIPHLQRTRADVRFLSIEPLLGPVLLNRRVLAGIHLVIVGGESGPRARRLQPEWVTDIKRRCEEFRVAFFFKQWGTCDENGRRVGKKTAGRILEGKTWNEMPETEVLR